MMTQLDLVELFERRLDQYDVEPRAVMAKLLPKDLHSLYEQARSVLSEHEAMQVVRYCRKAFRVDGLSVDAFLNRYGTERN